MSVPKVSICIPTYNGQKYLPEALESVKSQTYKDFEVVVSDDASSDNTLKIIENFNKSVDFPVVVFKHKHTGIGANWNNCLKNAKGDYIKFLFQDDVLEPSCLEKMVDVLDQQPKIGLVASKREFIINKSNNLRTKEWLKSYGDLQSQISQPERDLTLDKSLFKRKDFLKAPKNKIGEPSVVMFRRKIISEVGYFDESLQQILDYEYWYRILKKYSIYILNKPLVKFRLHDLQATEVNSKVQIKDYLVYPEILYHNYFWLLHLRQQKNLFVKYHWLCRLLKKLNHAI